MNALRSYSSAVAVLAGSLFLSGQSLAPDEVHVSSRAWQPATVFRAAASEVQVEVVVRDLKGRAVAGLKRSDFELLDNGKPQAVTSFQTEVRATAAIKTDAATPEEKPTTAANRPRDRYVALLFDDIHLQPPDMQHVRIAAKRFVNEGMREGDHVSLFTTSGEDSLDFTTEKQKMLSAIDHMQARPKQSEAGEPGCPRVRVHDAFLIAEQHDPGAYDSVHKQTEQCYCQDLEMPCNEMQIDELIKQQAERSWQQTRQLSLDSIRGIQAVIKYVSSRPGNRVLVLASPGFLTGNFEGAALDRAVDYAVRTGVVVNSLDAKGLYSETPGGTVDDLSEIHSQDAMSDPTGLVQQVESLGAKLGNMAQPMVEMSASTGGLWFHNNNDFIGGYRTLAAAPDIAYILSFSNAQLKRDGAFHKLKVKANVPGSNSIQARPGYYAVKVMPANPTEADKIDSAMQDTDELTEIPVEAKFDISRNAAGSPEVEVGLRVKLEAIPTKEEKGRHIQKLTFVGALFDSSGNVVVGKLGQMALNLKPESFDRFSKTGIEGKLSLAAPPGDYQLRIVVQEGLQGKMMATTKQITVK